MNAVAVVTGAGSGIGRAVSVELLAAGYRVALAGRREDPLRETAAGFGDAALVAPTDVTDPAAVEELFRATVAEFGRVDVLFNNAGIMLSGDVGDLSFADFERSVGVNVNGMFLCAQQAFRAMREQRPQGGRIINNGSISADRPRPASVAYTTTKHAVTGLTKSISLDGRRYRIACGQIDIGNAATEMTGAMPSGVPQADGSVAVEPTMDVRNVAGAVRYMADLPLDANVQFMTVMASAMPYIGRG
jgi:NADP-dependent 3-hydroxy acid dehydrogenase YdfG